MDCRHERIMSVNCVIKCADCGEILPIDYLVGKDKIKAQKAAGTPIETQENTPKKTTRKKVK